MDEAYELSLAKPTADYPRKKLFDFWRREKGSLDTLETRLLSEAASQRRSAALCVAARLAELDERKEKAHEYLHTAALLSPKSAEPRLAEAALYEREGDRNGALTSLREAEPLVETEARIALVVRLRDHHLALGEISKAEAEEERVERLDGTNSASAIEFAKALTEQGHPENALHVLERAEKRAGLSSAAQTQVGLEKARVLDALGRTAEAEKAAETVLGRSRGLGMHREVLAYFTGLLQKSGQLSEFLDQREAEFRTVEEKRLLASLLEGAGQLERAFALLAKLESQGSGDLDLGRDLARLALLVGRAEDAVAVRTRLTKKHPESVPVALDLISLLLDLGQREPANREFERILARSRAPEDLFALLEVVDRLEVPAQSQRVLEKLEHGTSREPHILVEVGRRKARQGNEDEAFAIFRDLPRGRENDAEAYLTMSTAFLEFENVKEATAALERARSLKPQDQKVLRAVALGYERAAALTNTAGALPYLKKAEETWVFLRRLAPPLSAEGRGETRRHLIRLWQRQGRLETEIRETARRLETKLPTLDDALLLAEAEARRGEVKGERRALTRALELERENPEALRALAILEEKEGNTRAALDAYERLLRVDDKNHGATLDRMMALAVTLGHEGSDLARKYAESAVIREPNNAGAAARLAERYALGGELSRAEQHYERARTLDPTNPEFTFRLLDLYSARPNPKGRKILLDLLARTRDPDVSLVLLARGENASLAISSDELTRLAADKALLFPARAEFSAFLLGQYEKAKTALETRDAPAAERAALSQKALPHLLRLLASSSSPNELETVLDLLDFAPQKGSGASLVAFAQSRAPERLRVRAILIAGTLEDPKLRSNFGQLVFGPASVVGDLARAAAWALARLGPSPELRRCLESGDEVISTYALIGIGKLPFVPSSRGPSDALFRAVALGFGFGAENANRLAEDELAVLFRMAAPEARAKLGEELGRALFSNSLALKNSALAALFGVEMTRSAFGKALLARPQGNTVTPEEPLRALLESAPSPLERAEAVLRQNASLEAILATEMQRGPEFARRILPEFDDETTGLFSKKGVNPKVAAALDELRVRLRAELAPLTFAIAKSSTDGLRALAVAALPAPSDRPAPSRDELPQTSFGDLYRELLENKTTRSVTLHHLAVLSDPLAHELIITEAETGALWSERREAVEALGKALEKAAGEDRVALEKALEKARSDPHALVRREADLALRADQR